MDDAGDQKPAREQPSGAVVAFRLIALAGAIAVVVGLLANGSGASDGNKIALIGAIAAFGGFAVASILSSIERR